MAGASHTRLTHILDYLEKRPPPNALCPSAGQITRLMAGIIDIEGLPEASFEELIALPGGGFALAADLKETRIRAAPLTEPDITLIGGDARATGRQVDTPVGPSLLGRIVDPLGNPLDGKAPPSDTVRSPIHRDAPPVLARSAITRPLQTGILAIDAAIPIGRGQRELILGDRQTGKTSIAVDTIINQADDVTCIYCSIGQRASSVARVRAALEAHRAIERTIIVVAGGNDTPASQYIAPFSAMTMAEHFAHNGQDALIVFDDLTRHAEAYRELSLLLERPPGREAFPGDIFYLHARLLERAAQLGPAAGGGSLTALPIVELQAGAVASYIPTNLISITDGQILTSSDLFQTGQLPAINIGLSVSRVGGKAQAPAYRKLASALKLAYAQFEELEAFSRFGTRLDDSSMQRLTRGRRVREVLKQNERNLYDVRTQYALLLASTGGYLDHISPDKLPAMCRQITEHIAQSPPPWNTFEASAPIDDKLSLAFEHDLAALTGEGELPPTAEALS